MAVNTNQVPADLTGAGGLSGPGYLHAAATSGAQFAKRYPLDCHNQQKPLALQQNSSDQVPWHKLNPKLVTFKPGRQKGLLYEAAKPGAWRKSASAVVPISGQHVGSRCFRQMR